MKGKTLDSQGKYRRVDGTSPENLRKNSYWRFLSEPFTTSEERRGKEGRRGNTPIYTGYSLREWTQKKSIFPREGRATASGKKNGWVVLLSQSRVLGSYHDFIG